MSYAIFEAQILSDFQQRFTEYHKGRSLPGGDMQESEWRVQADVEELQGFLRTVLREVRKHTLTEIKYHLDRLAENTVDSAPPQTLRITFPDGFIRYANCCEGNSAHVVVSSILEEERGRHGKDGDVHVTHTEERQTWPPSPAA